MSKIIYIVNRPDEIHKHVIDVLSRFDFAAAKEYIAKIQASGSTETKFFPEKSGLSHTIVNSSGNFHILTEYALGDGKYGRVRLAIPIDEGFASANVKTLAYSDYSKRLRAFKSWRSSENIASYALGVKIYQLLHGAPELIRFTHKPKVEGDLGAPGAYLNMPLLSAPLHNWIQSKSKLSSCRKLMFVCLNLARTVYSLHSKEFVLPANKDGIDAMIVRDPGVVLKPGERSWRAVHRDIKLQNITFNEITGEVELADFDFAVLENGQEYPVRGSAYYMPPDVENTISQKFDIYAAAGCMGLILQDRSVMANKSEADNVRSHSGGTRRSGMERYRPIFHAPYLFKLDELRELMTQELGRSPSDVAFIKQCIDFLTRLLYKLGRQSQDKRAASMDVAVQVLSEVINNYLSYQLSKTFSAPVVRHIVDFAQENDLLDIAVEELLLQLMQDKRQAIPEQLITELKAAPRYLAYLMAAKTGDDAWKASLQLHQEMDSPILHAYYGAPKADASAAEEKSSGKFKAGLDDGHLVYVNPAYKNYAITKLEKEASDIESSWASILGSALTWHRGQYDSKRQKVEHIRQVVIPKIRRDEGLTPADMDLLKAPTGLKAYLSSRTNSAKIMSQVLKPQEHGYSM